MPKSMDRLKDKIIKQQEALKKAYAAEQKAIQEHGVTTAPRRAAQAVGGFVKKEAGAVRRAVPGQKIILAKKVARKKEEQKLTDLQNALKLANREKWGKRLKWVAPLVAVAAVAGGAYWYKRRIDANKNYKVVNPKIHKFTQNGEYWVHIWVDTPGELGGGHKRAIRLTQDVARRIVSGEYGWDPAIKAYRS